MPKKDFIALADCLKGLKPSAPASAEQADLWRDTVFALADFCAGQNERFNRSRWLAYIAGECGPNGGAVKAQAVRS